MEEGIVHHPETRHTALVTPTPDYCWEGRLAVVTTLLSILLIFLYLRVRAVRGFNYSTFSPRGISGTFVLAATALCTAYTCLTIWNYMIWYQIRGIYETSATDEDEAYADHLLEDMRRIIPDNRKQVSFVMRMMLVTVLWLVKGSFILVYYEFAEALPKRIQALLHATSATVFLSYAAIWLAIGLKMGLVMELEDYRSNAGAGVALFTPPNTWSTWTVPEDVMMKRKHDEVPALLLVEYVITGLNVLSDIMILALVYIIFQYLQLQRGRSSLKAALMMLILSSVSIAIAFARLGVLCSGMARITVRLAFDSLTEFEAFIAACAACIPAMRVLARGASQRFEIGFPEKWGSVGSLSRSMQSIRSFRGRREKSLASISTRDLKSQGADSERQLVPSFEWQVLQKEKETTQPVDKDPELGIRVTSEVTMQFEDLEREPESVTK